MGNERWEALFIYQGIENFREYVVDEFF